MAQTKENAFPVKTVEELRNDLLLLQQAEQTLKTQMRERRAKMHKLNQEQAVDEMTHRDLGRSIMETTNRILTRTPLPPHLVKERRLLIARIRLSLSEEITVTAQKALKMQIGIDRSALEKLCTHPFVFSYDGYAGSSSFDFDDARHGRRVCVLCNFRETSRGNSVDIYHELKEDETRLVRRDLRPKTILKSFEREWFAVDFLRQLFEHSAGSLNIEWPQKTDEQLVRES